MEKLIALLFLSRDLAHRAHLKTKSYAQHVALGSFYTDVIGLADTLAEAYQGYKGLMGEIPLLTGKPGDIKKVLREHLEIIEANRADVCDLDYTPIQSVIDDICALYLSTLYKLENLSC